MTKPQIRKQLDFSLGIGHWSFIGHWSLVIGHSSRGIPPSSPPPPHELSASDRQAGARSLVFADGVRCRAAGWNPGNGDLGTGLGAEVVLAGAVAFGDRWRDSLPA